jgi:hypothetical protein
VVTSTTGHRPKPTPRPTQLTPTRGHGSGTHSFKPLPDMGTQVCDVVTPVSCLQNQGRATLYSQPMPIRRPCLTCRQLTTEPVRCTSCQSKRQALTDAHRTHKRDHYKGDYQARAKAVRESATHCWLCGEAAREGDPWQADHIYPGVADSPLAPAHRSCNIRRRFMTGT